MSKKEKTIFISRDFETISSFLASRSEYLRDITNNKDYDDVLFICKTISHSDIPFAKRTKSTDGYDKNSLYYLTADETKKRELNETTHQTSINPGTEFFKFLDLPTPSQRRNNPINENIVNYADIYLLNDENLKYFSKDYTEKVITKLNKPIPKSLAHNSDSHTHTLSLSIGTLKN